jgi:hypothetical protein
MKAVQKQSCRVRGLRIFDRALLLALILLVLAGSHPLPAQSSDRATAAKLKDFDAWMAQTLKDWNVPGIGVGIVVFFSSPASPSRSSSPTRA